MTSLNMPRVLDTLEGQGLLLGLFLCGAGLVFMLAGARVAKALVAISFGVVGFVIGSLVPTSEAMQTVLGVVGAALLATVSMLALRVAVALLAGGWACLAMLGLCRYLAVADNMSLALGLMALAAAISLAFIMYEEILALVTSFEGVLLLFSGLVVFLSRHAAVWRPIRTLLTEMPVFLPFLVLAGTVTGFYLQQADLRRKDMSGGG